MEDTFTIRLFFICFNFPLLWFGENSRISFGLVEKRLGNDFRGDEKFDVYDVQAKVTCLTQDSIRMVRSSSGSSFRRLA